jgi:hypothetical protein
MYSEAQITELTSLVSRLQKSARRDIPRQARRIFVESQIEANRDSLLSAMKQHEILARELSRLSVESESIPADIASVVDSSIVAPAIERHRQVRRLYLVIIVLVVATLFPRILEYIHSVSRDVLGDQPRPFGAENTLDFFGGCIVAICLALVIPERWMRRVYLRRRIGIAVGCSLLVLGVGGLIYMAASLAMITPGWAGYTTQASIVSAVCFGMSARILRDLSPKFKLAARRTRPHP